MLTVTNILRTAGTVVLLIVGIIVLFIIVNTIRLAVVARAEEIEIMRLVGASDAFIRWPFVFEGAFVGLLGSLLTLGILAAAADPISGFMVDFFRVLPLQFGSLTRDLVAPRRWAPASGLGHPRLVAVGPDLPDPLRRRAAHGAMPEAVPETRCTLVARSPPVVGPVQDRLTDGPREPVTSAAERPTPAHRQLAVDPTLDPARRPARGPVQAAAPPRRRRSRSCSIAIVVVAVLAGAALFMSGYTMGRHASEQPGTAGLRRARPSSRSGTPTTRSPTATPAARSIGNALIQGAIRG